MDRCFICEKTLSGGTTLAAHMAVKHIEITYHRSSTLTNYRCFCGKLMAHSLYGGRLGMERHLMEVSDLHAHYLEGVMNKIAEVGGE